jgi:hypothetical protein
MGLHHIIMHNIKHIQCRYLSENWLIHKVVLYLDIMYLCQESTNFSYEGSTRTMPFLGYSTNAVILSDKF